MITDENAKKLILGMFQDGQLDAHPSTDAAPEYELKFWCGYEKDYREPKKKAVKK